MRLPRTCRSSSVRGRRGGAFTAGFSAGLTAGADLTARAAAGAAWGARAEGAAWGARAAFTGLAPTGFATTGFATTGFIPAGFAVACFAFAAPAFAGPAFASVALDRALEGAFALVRPAGTDFAFVAGLPAGLRGFAEGLAAGFLPGLGRVADRGEVRLAAGRALRGRAGEALRAVFQGGVAVGERFLDVRVVLQSQVVDLHQIAGQGSAGREQRDEEQQDFHQGRMDSGWSGDCAKALPLAKGERRKRAHAQAQGPSPCIMRQIAALKPALLKDARPSARAIGQ